ncbi:MAG: cupin domain-containing protein [Candidatus Kariarchaeaceae archaeon]|jgi:mannose-6-phosphate isomerase-like protein (cupin superfamily)
MKVDLNTEIEKLKADGGYWKSFVEEDNFELGVLYLRPGQEDVQNPHKSDEVYFITDGNGYITIDGVDHEITPGSAFVVMKGTAHKFHSNTKPIVGYYALN